MVIFKSLRHSYGQLQGSWNSVFKAAFADFFFVFLFGFIISFLLRLAASSISGLITTLQSMNTDLIFAFQDNVSPFSILFSDPSVASNLKTIIGTFLLIVFVLCIFWIFIEGYSWYQAYRTGKNKLSFRKYLVLFSDMSIFWFVILALLFISTMWFVFFALVRQTPLLSDSAIILVSDVITALFLYCAFISFSLVPLPLGKNIKKTFSVAFRPSVIMTSIFTAVLIALNLFITAQLAGLIAVHSLTGAYILVAIRFLLVAPCIMFARIAVINAVQH